MNHETIKLCTNLLHGRNEDAISLVSKFVEMSKDFQKELKDHMDSKVRIADLEREVMFLKRLIDDSENS